MQEAEEKGKLEWVLGEGLEEMMCPIWTLSAASRLTGGNCSPDLVES